MKPLLLRLHRWAALLFALPLLAVIVTGLILSFEPVAVMSAIKPGSLTPDTITAALAKHDPQGQARAVGFRSYENTLTLGAGRGGGIRVDAATGDARTGGGRLADLMQTSRRLHETLLLDATWLVITSTVAMLVLSVLGILMGWPRLANTVSGWHKGMAWGLLPLLILSPLTGLFLAMGVTFTSPPPRPAQVAEQAPPLKLADAVKIAGAKHDLSGLVWLRPQRGSMMMRIVEGGEYRVYVVTPQGTTPTARNWPRLWHEGNFAGIASTIPNILTSLASLGLLVTGIWIWARRKLRPRNRSHEPLPSSA